MRGALGRSATFVRHHLQDLSDLEHRRAVAHARHQHQLQGQVDLEQQAGEEEDEQQDEQQRDEQYEEPQDEQQVERAASVVKYIKHTYR